MKNVKDYFTVTYCYLLRVRAAFQLMPAGSLNYLPIPYQAIKQLLVNEGWELKSSLNGETRVFLLSYNVALGAGTHLKVWGFKQSSIHVFNRICLLALRKVECFIGVLFCPTSTPN